MKQKELLKLDLEDLIEQKKDLIFELVKVKSTGTLDDKKAKVKGISSPKEKTSRQRQIRRMIAQVNTEIRRREIQDGKEMQT